MTSILEKDFSVDYLNPKNVNIFQNENDTRPDGRRAKNKPVTARTLPGIADEWQHPDYYLGSPGR